MIWKTLSGKLCKDPYPLITKLGPLETMSVHIGADSQSYRDKTIVITTICIREKNNGVIVFWKSDIIDRPETLRERLLHEAMTAIQTANEVLQKTNIKPTVHLDISPKSTNESNKFYTELTGMVTGCGYQCVTKPSAFAAALADSFSRTPNEVQNAISKKE